MCVCLCVCMYVCMYVCIYVCMHAGMYVCMYVCMYVFIKCLNIYNKYDMITFPLYLCIAKSHGNINTIILSV